MTLFKRFIASAVALTLCLALFSGCEKKKGNETANATPTPSAGKDSSADDKPLTTDFVAKIAGQEIYSSEFYYFLYSGIREIYYSNLGNVYDDSLTEEENYQKMLEFLNSTAEDGKTYKQKVIDRTLEIAAGFYAASILCKQEGEKNPDNAITQEEIDEMMEMVDNEADYGASYYSCSRDEFFFYSYGMNVNDGKRYTETQMYAQKHEELWAKENGYEFNLTAPKEPTKPKDLDKDASDTEKEKYQAAMDAYEKEMEKHKADTEKYEKALGEYWEKFRGFYEEALTDEGINDYDISTVRYLYVSTLDKDGKPFSEDEKAKKKAEAEKYMQLAEDGLDFSKLVKGFSESETATTDLGLFDINKYADSELTVPVDAITWATKNTTPVSDEIKLFSDDTGYYLVQKVGYTNFDETKGIVASDTTASPDIVKSNVEYTSLAKLYNDAMNEILKTEEFKLTDVNTELMASLMDEYIKKNAE